jgi:hypothetical protein
MRPVLIHSKFVEATIPEMPAKAVFVFGAAICQRVWPIFLDGLRRTENRDANELTAKFTAVWNSLAGLAASPSPIAPAFLEAVPSPELPLEDAPFFDSAGMLSHFAEIFDEGRPKDMIYVSDAPLSLLDGIFYDSSDMEVSDENDLIIDNHPLLVRELKRQKADLSELSKRADSETVLSIWARSKSEHLLD